MTSISKILFSIIFIGFFTVAAFAHSYKVADLEIKHPHARATLKNARVSGGYLTITNNGTTDDTLIGALVGFAGKTEIHEMKMDGDVMKMRPLEKGVLIPAGKSVTLQSGSNHIMFMKLKEQLNEGEKRKGTLTFEKAGTVDVVFSVESLMKIKARAKKNKEMGHDQMKHEGMKEMKHE